MFTFKWVIKQANEALKKREQFDKEFAETEKRMDAQRQKMDEWKPRLLRERE
jgi:hypothetical protein